MVTSWTSDTETYLGEEVITLDGSCLGATLFYMANLLLIINYNIVQFKKKCNNLVLRGSDRKTLVSGR